MKICHTSSDLLENLIFANIFLLLFTYSLARSVEVELVSQKLMKRDYFNSMLKVSVLKIVGTKSGLGYRRAKNMLTCSVFLMILVLNILTSSHVPVCI